MSGRPKSFDPAAALDRAKDLFWSHGYQATNLDRLLSSMNVGRQSVYDTFGSKHELFMAAFKDYLAHIKRDLGQLFANPALTPHQRVHAFIDFAAHITAERSTKGCLLTNTIVELAPHHPEIRDFASRALLWLENQLTDQLTLAQSAGDVPPTHSPRSLARLIVVAFEGCLIVTKTDQSSTIPDALSVLKTLV